MTALARPQSVRIAGDRRHGNHFALTFIYATTPLDALIRIEMHALIERLWREHRFSALLVTHNVQEVVLLGDHRILLIESGKIALDQPVPLERPRARDSAAFAALEDRVLRRVLEGCPVVDSPDAFEAPGSPQPLSAGRSEAARPRFTKPIGANPQ